LDDWLQSTLRSLPSAPSIVQAKVLAFLEVSTVGTKSKKAPQRRSKPSTFMTKQQFGGNIDGGGGDSSRA